MSDTPRTDAMIFKAGLVAEVCLVTPAGYARTLERELAALRAELAAAKRDAERYRWLRDDAPVSEIEINDMIMLDPAKTDENFDAAIDEATGEIVVRVEE